jgi:hypothetical protein
MYFLRISFEHAGVSADHHRYLLCHGHVGQECHFIMLGKKAAIRGKAVRLTHTGKSIRKKGKTDHPILTEGGDWLELPGNGS